MQTKSTELWLKGSFAVLQPNTGTHLTSVWTLSRRSEPPPIGKLIHQLTLLKYLAIQFFINSFHKTYDIKCKPINLAIQNISKLLVTEQQSRPAVVNTRASHQRGTRFKSLPGHSLSRVRFFTAFNLTYRKVLPDNFLPKSSKLKIATKFLSDSYITEGA